MTDIQAKRAVAAVAWSIKHFNRTPTTLRPEGEASATLDSDYEGGLLKIYDPEIKDMVKMTVTTNILSSRKYIAVGSNPSALLLEAYSGNEVYRAEDMENRGHVYLARVSSSEVEVTDQMDNSKITYTIY
jgi:hypothetical protein